jgi:CDP-paratose 2-epimerase
MICLVTGSGGLVGSASVEYFCSRFDKVVGIDNDMRSHFFGPDASTAWNTQRLIRDIANFESRGIDIRNLTALGDIFAEYGSRIRLIIHAAAQPSHDWAASDPFTDFSVNANGTLNLLELTRRHCPEATFIFTSTNKVYGDTPNSLPLQELDTRWEIADTHPYHAHGIDEGMSIDQTRHSLFGASKVAADILVQEYGRYFRLNTGVFRGGCLTGPNHSGAKLHGFLSYLMKCAVTGEKYTVLGYRGKQVRDNIHSHDLVSMFWHFHLHPRPGEVYNAGGSRHSNCSMAEAIERCQQIAQRPLNHAYVEDNRIGDHIWWISDVRKFQSHYPSWNYRYGLNDILCQIHEALTR